MTTIYLIGPRKKAVAHISSSNGGYSLCRMLNVTNIDKARRSADPDGRKVCKPCLFVADETEWYLELEDLRIKQEKLLPKAEAGDPDATDELQRMRDRRLEIIQLIETGRPAQ